MIADPDWHLIFGGFSYDLDLTADIPVDSVELYNWKNGQQCQLPNLNYPVYAQPSVVMNGTPAYCGGLSNQELVQCWIFDKVTKTWMQMSCCIDYFIVKQNIKIC